LIVKSKFWTAVVPGTRNTIAEIGLLARVLAG